MNHFHGEIYRVIDSNGSESGLCVFIEKCPPHSLSTQECRKPGFWNFKVLRDGKIDYLDTGSWSLLTVADRG
jgi:hypothetical protein